MLYIFVVYSTIDIPEESPSLSHIESNNDSERVIPQDIADSFDSEICQVMKSQSVGPHRASSTPPTTWFSSRLSELDAQLDALQKIADYLDTDFSNTRMVHTHVVFVSILLIFLMTACQFQHLSCFIFLSCFE